MKTIKISQKDFQRMRQLYNDFYEVFGDEDTDWELTDLDEMIKISEEFMDIVVTNF